MPTPPTSTIAIEYDGTDITSYVLFNSATFECQANAVPGTFRFTVKDENQDQSFVTGKEVYLYVDGVKLFGGLVMRVSRQFALPVDNTIFPPVVKTRQWVIEGADFNIWFDKRVIRDTSNYLKAIITLGTHTDGQLIRDFMPNYIDVPPGVTIGAYVEDIAEFGEMPTEELAALFGIQYAWVQQGDTWRKQMDSFAARSAAVYYIDPDKNLHFHSLETVSVPWSFVDSQPNGVTRIPCREVSAQEDGSVIVNDALVWGTNEVTEIPIAFARAQDAESQALIGRWQIGEIMSPATQGVVDGRARRIVFGDPGADSEGVVEGLRYALWRFNLTWFGHDIPGAAHIRPGNLVNIQLAVMGTSGTPLQRLLPLRNMTVSFPQLAGNGEAWVKFEGEFGISYSDSRHLWRFLIKRSSPSSAVMTAGISNSSTSSQFGDFGTFTPIESPNGVRSEFNFAFPMLSNTIEVYVNGLRWREGFEYTVTGASTILLNSPLASDDQIYIQARTGVG